MNENKREQTFGSNLEDINLPSVSVIMPVYNEAEYIDRSLGAVLNQDYPSEKIEVILVDGISSDATREKIALCAGKRANVILIDNPKKIVSAGLNMAIQRAKGTILVRVDGHCEIAPDYIRNCVQHLMDSDIVGVGGAMETVGETPLAKTIALAMSSRFGVGNSAFRTTQGRSMYVETVPFPAYWRAEVLAAGPFDEELVRNQDDEYNYRLCSRGGKLLLAANVHSRYYSRSNLRSLWQQYYQYGYFKVRVMQKHFRQMRLRQFVPAIFLAGLAASILFALTVSKGWLLLAVYTGLYLASDLSVTVWIASQRGVRHIILLSIAFAILHLSYGLGFWHGLARYSVNWRTAKGLKKAI